jgi:hypothetical protein
VDVLAVPRVVSHPLAPHAHGGLELLDAEICERAVRFRGVHDHLVRADGGARREELGMATALGEWVRWCGGVGIAIPERRVQVRHHAHQPPG